MPYHIGEKGTSGCSGYPVVKDSDGEVMGCHKTEEDAKQQLAALYANEKTEKAEGYVPPQEVRSNAKRGLELREKYGRGGTAVGVARARDLSNGASLSLSTIRRMVSYFARHEVDKKGEGWGKDSAGYIAWLLWGGDAGRSWANRINNESKKKEKSMSVDFAISYAEIIKKEKQEDGTLLVYGKATDDAIDSDNQICDAAWLNKAMPEWFKTGGNIREQHSSIAAGVAKELDSKADGHYIMAHVVDSQSVKKVEAGVLKGFSIGIRAPRVVRDDKAANGRIIDGQIVEISLVDRPANPNAKLMLAKSDGTEVIQVEELTVQEVTETLIAEEIEETIVEADAEKKASREYGESAEEETAEGSESGAAEEEVEESKGKKPLDKTAGCDCDGCKECAKDGGCDKDMCKGHMKSKSIDKCLDCGCHKPADSHGNANVSTAEMVEEKSSTTILPRIGVDGEDLAETNSEEEEDANKSAISDTTISAIIEKAVKSATETVASEINAYKDAVTKLEAELAAANNKAAAGGPKRSVLKTNIDQLGEFLAKAAEYRAKSAVASDKELSRGYKELADDFESKAKALEIN